MLYLLRAMPQDVKITEVIGAIRAIAQREAKAGKIKLDNPNHYLIIFSSTLSRRTENGMKQVLAARSC